VNSPPLLSRGAAAQKSLLLSMGINCQRANKNRIVVQQEAVDDDMKWVNPVSI
jgi:hypothetical protein